MIDRERSDRLRQAEDARTSATSCSGIGRLVAHRFAHRHKCKLVLWDLNEALAIGNLRRVAAPEDGALRLVRCASRR